MALLLCTLISCVKGNFRSWYWPVRQVSHRNSTVWLFNFSLVGWLVVLRIYVALAVFQPYRDLEAGDNQSLKIQVARPGTEPRSSCSTSQELYHSATAAPTCIFECFLQFCHYNSDYYINMIQVTLHTICGIDSVVCPIDCTTVAGSGKVGPLNFRLTAPLGWLLSLHLTVWIYSDKN